MNANPANLIKCDRSLLSRYLSEQLSSDEQSQLEQHLHDCERCCQWLDDEAATPAFWDDAAHFLRDTALADEQTDAPDSTPADLQRVLKLILNPTDDPRMLGRFDGHEIAGVIGRGGMGVVLKGFDTSLNRYVAIKVLDPSYAATSAARRRFAREAQAAAAVVHDNVIAIHHVRQAAEYPSLVMPYVKGESLQQRIDRAAPMDVESMLEISLQIARGLAAAHDQGLVHRDIKPANILLPESVSRVIITDFGLARAADDASLTRTGIVAGTPQYMSPEQVRGGPLDHRVDLFSLGSVMYAMASGRPPFRADTAYGVMRRITDDQPRPLTEYRADLPVWFTEIVDRLLQKQTDDRFESANVLAEHLEDCLAYLRQPATVDLPRIPDIAEPRRWRWPAAAGIVATIALTAWGLSSWRDQRRPQPITREPGVDTPRYSMPEFFADPLLDELEDELTSLDEVLNVPPFQNL